MPRKWEGDHWLSFSCGDLTDRFYNLTPDANATISTPYVDPKKPLELHGRPGSFLLVDSPILGPAWNDFADDYFANWYSVGTSTEYQYIIGQYTCNWM